MSGENGRIAFLPLRSSDPKNFSGTINGEFVIDPETASLYYKRPSDGKVISIISIEAIQEALMDDSIDPNDPNYKPPRFVEHYEGEVLKNLNLTELGKNEDFLTLISETDFLTKFEELVQNAPHAIDFLKDLKWAKLFETISLDINGDLVFDRGTF